MNEAVTALIQSAIDDLGPRILIHEANIATARATLESEQHELDQLTAQRDELQAALPKPAPTAPDKTDEPAVSA